MDGSVAGLLRGPLPLRRTKARPPRAVRHAGPNVARWPTLSPGERRRWQVGAALAAQPSLLLLDEPTDHLDIPAIERLEEALAAWRGALVLATHDAALAARCTEETWAVAEGRVQVESGAGSGGRDQAPSRTR